MLKNRARAVMLLIVAALLGYFVYVSSLPGGSYPFRLGLDLSGGTHLVYSADISKIPAASVADSMTALQQDVERRINVFGVSEPVVQVVDTGALGGGSNSEHQLIVELPGVTDVDQAVKTIGATPELDFRLVTAAALNAFNASSSAYTSTTTQEAAYLALFQPTGLNGGMVSTAALEFDSTNQPLVSLTFNAQGAALFDQITKAHVGDSLGIFLDGDPISVPVIQQEIGSGQAQISGNFSIPDAQTLVRNINFGALPVPITLISTQTIGPTLGQAAVNGGIKAGIVSFIIIALFLILWYRLPGLVAVIALAVYTVLMLLIFKLLPVTLTAAGIAGFIITIGMAVDANILIFERMKEELHAGRGISDAMHEGFARAWTSIRDSNISSIITGAILYYFGSTSIVTGFALVFVIGVLVSMFTAITASRMLLYAVAPTRPGKLSTFLISNGFGGSMKV